MSFLGTAAVPLKGSRSSLAFLDFPKRPRKVRRCCCPGEQKCEDEDADAEDDEGVPAEVEAAATKWVMPLRLLDLVSIDPAEEVRLIGRYELERSGISDEGECTMAEDYE